MKRAMMQGFTTVLAAGLIICALVTAVIFDWQLTATKEEDLAALAQLAAVAFDPESSHDAQAKQFASGGLRVTIIAESGAVTGDSEADYTQMPNHSQREEILKAAENGSAVTIRNSDTLGQKLMYAVVRTGDGGYIRLSQEYSGILADFISFLPAIFAALLLALACSVAMAGRLTARITRPILEINTQLDKVKGGTLRLDAQSYPYPELREMAVQINQMSADVAEHIGHIQAERDKINYILDNMGEGFLMLDSHKRILLINKSACRYLDCPADAAGHSLSYVTRERALLEGVDAALEYRLSQRAELARRGQILEARIAPVGPMDGSGDGLVLLLSDITADRRAAQMRQEFFSNASHELKTPITAIQGSSELLLSGLPLSDGQRDELLTRIEAESRRLTTLVEDIIMLSRIESGGMEEDAEDVDLSAVLRTCMDEMAVEAAARQVTVSAQLQPVRLWGSAKSLHQLVGNLLSNAIKYNTPGGRVDICLTEEAGQAELTIRNDGEPIPPEHQGRVFERFYRVDSGRSRTVGGTGLGLSIAKHVVDSMGGSIILTSRPGLGTEFSVVLPKRGCLA